MLGYVTGWAHSKFGRLEEETIEILVVRTARDAHSHAGPSSSDTSTTAWTRKASHRRSPCMPTLHSDSSPRRA